MSIRPLNQAHTGEVFAISTPLLYTLMDFPMSRKLPKTTGAAISEPTSLLDDTAPKCAVLIQQYCWPDNVRGGIGFGWDVVLVFNPSKIIFRVLDNATIFHYLTELEAIEWVTPVSKIVDIGQIADLDVTIT